MAETCKTKPRSNVEVNRTFHWSETTPIGTRSVRAVQPNNAITHAMNVCLVDGESPEGVWWDRKERNVVVV